MFQYDDEELAMLAEQERFFSSGEKSSVTLGERSTDNKKKPSLFKQRRQQQQKSDSSDVIVADIVTENLTTNKIIEPPCFSIKESFPKALHRSQDTKSFGGRTRDNKTVQLPVDSSNSLDLTKPFNVQLSKTIRIKYSKLEEEKMKWQESVSVDTKSKSNDKDIVIDGIDKWRFDFNGRLLDGDIDEATERRSELYHHGKEPELPGYTIEELLHLSRSSFPQQRTIAMNTLSSIISNARRRNLSIPSMELWMLKLNLYSNLFFFFFKKFWKLLLMEILLFLFVLDWMI